MAAVVSGMAVSKIRDLVLPAVQAHRVGARTAGGASRLGDFQLALAAWSAPRECRSFVNLAEIPFADGGIRKNDGPPGAGRGVGTAAEAVRRFVSFRFLVLSLFVAFVLFAAASKKRQKETGTDTMRRPKETKRRTGPEGGTRAPRSRNLLFQQR
jgi:hypothetical protein